MLAAGTADTVGVRVLEAVAVPGEPAGTLGAVADREGNGMTATTEPPNAVRWLLDPRVAAGPGAAADLAAVLPILEGLRGEHVVEARRFAAQVAGGYGPDHPVGQQDVIAFLAARALGATVVEMSPGDARPDGMFFLTGCWDPPIRVGEVLVGSVLGQRDLCGRKGRHLWHCPM